MKRKNLFLLSALIAGLGLIVAGRLTAQTFTTLYSFTEISAPLYTNSDGTSPNGLVLSGNTLYGTARGGGTSGNGTVFAVNTDGTGFTNLYSFTGGCDGDSPWAGLILSGNTLYGTTWRGGSLRGGTVFAVNTDGTGFTNLQSDGDYIGYLRAELVLSGNTLYGTSVGDGGDGWIFAVNTNGTGFTHMHDFSGDSDGGIPFGGLILSGDTLYGTAAGGSLGYGAVFAVNTDGTGFTNLYSFTGGSNGVSPEAGLVLSGKTLYGTTGGGGSSGGGTVFSVTTKGTGFATLHSFAENSSPGSCPCLNSDGLAPFAGLILSGNTLYGTAFLGGSSGNGTVFAVNTDGTGFTNLYIFTESGGSRPSGSLILSGNTLYGAAGSGGSSGSGAVFSISFRPQLTIIPFEANVILTWPTNVAGFSYAAFTLQSTTNLVSPAVWTTVSPGPVVVNGQNAVTNPISGTQQFYRLSQ